MDERQKEYLAKKAEKMNPDWLKTGKYIENLDNLNVASQKILIIIEKLPKILKYIIAALILANAGIWIRWVFDLFIKYLL